MTTTGVSDLFLDTHVLVYANVTQAPLHAHAAATIQHYYNAGAEVWISRQVLREYLVTLTRPQSFMNPQPVSTVIARVRLFETEFRIAEDNRQVTVNLLALMGQIPVGGKRVHDANIVATMQAYGICHLLTNNTADFARFAQVITVLPL